MFLSFSISLRKRRVLACIAATLSFSVPAHSLDTHSQKTRSLETLGLETRGLETLVVSGSRYPEALKNVGASITPIETNINAQHISEIASQAPGTWISRGNGQEHLTAIRSPVFTGAGACGAFMMAQDGIPLRASGFCNVNQLFDSHYEAAQRIEIFRGPNSAAFGSNALFGGVNVILPNPANTNPANTNPANNNPGFFDLDYDQFNYQRAALQYSRNGQKNHSWMAATVTDDEGYRDDSGFQQEKFSIKHAWRGEVISVDNAVHYTNLKQETAGFITGEDAYKERDLIRTNANPEAYRNAESLRAHSRWQWTRANSELSITPYYRRNEMDFLMHFVPWQPVEQNQQESVGAQFFWRTKISEAFTWLASVESEASKASLTEVQFNPAPFNQAVFPVGIHYDYDVKASSNALLINAQWKILPALNLDFTGRYDTHRYNYENNTESGSACAQSVTNCRFYRPASGSDQFDFISKKFAAIYTASDSLLFYGNVSSAFRNPQATELYRLQQGQEHADLDEVRINSQELGIRRIFPRLTVDLALYNMKTRDDIFLDSERQYVSGANSQHQGIEYSVAWALSDALKFDLSGTYAQHNYDNNPNIQGAATLLKGNDMDTAPRNLNHFSIEWQAHPKLSLEATASKMGNYYTNAENTAEYPGHTLFSIQSQFNMSNRLDLHVAINNILDSRYAERADIAFGTPRYFPGQERTVFIKLRWYFKENKSQDF